MTNLDMIFHVVVSVYRFETRPSSLMNFGTANKPHICIFLRNTSCIRKSQVISGGGGHPLHPPPRSAPVMTIPYREQVDIWGTLLFFSGMIEMGSS